MNGIVYIIQKIWTFFFSIKGYLPKSIAGIFLVSTFVSNFVSYGFETAIRELALSIVSAELIIHKNVTLAVEKSPEYGFYEFMQIVISVMILWWLIKYITKLLVKISGSQAEWGAVFMAIVFVMLIEYVGIAILVTDFSFIPIYNGLFYLLINSQAVLFHINWFNFGFIKTLMVNQTQTLANTTEPVIEMLDKTA